MDLEYLSVVNRKHVKFCSVLFLMAFFSLWMKTHDLYSVEYSWLQPWHCWGYRAGNMLGTGIPHRPPRRARLRSASWTLCAVSVWRWALLCFFFSLPSPLRKYLQSFSLLQGNITNEMYAYMKNTAILTSAESKTAIPQCFDSEQGFMWQKWISSVQIANSTGIFW